MQNINAIRLSVRLIFCLLLLTSCKGIELARIKNGVSNTYIKYTGFTVSYNSHTKTPNWVAWELTDIKANGSEPRAKHYKIDPNLMLPQANNNDYRNSGWDRGHMAPAGDMKWSSQAMLESFYFTNISPQNNNLNSGVWKLLEEKCREIAKTYGRLYIVCGPINNIGAFNCIGENRVSVPDAFFKVLLLKVDRDYKGVGFIFDNKAGRKPLISYTMSIDSVEQTTGIDFFYKLKNSVEKRVEKSVEEAFWENLLK